MRGALLAVSVVCAACARDYPFLEDAGTALSCDAGVRCGPECCAPARSVSAGRGFACAVLASGEVACWGRKFEEGSASAAFRARPERVSGLANVTSVAAGDTHACALDRDGAVFCWGNNALGQLGDGTTETHATPVRVNVTPATQISAADTHACARTKDGVAFCWGNNGGGQLGTARDTAANPPRAVRVDVAYVSAGHIYTCVVDPAGAAACTGLDINGELGDRGPKGNRFGFVPVVDLTQQQTSVAASVSSTTCAVDIVGNVRCWGSNANDKLGGQTTDPSSNVPLIMHDAPRASAVAVGGTAVCTLSVDGGKVSCWGANGDGELGNGKNEPSAKAVLVTGLSDATQITAGERFACALLANGGVRCWGRNTEGQLGDGTTTARREPVTVIGL